jgi:hypothetical protein
MCEVAWSLPPQRCRGHNPRGTPTLWWSRAAAVPSPHAHVLWRNADAQGWLPCTIRFFNAACIMSLDVHETLRLRDADRRNVAPPRQISGKCAARLLRLREPRASELRLRRCVDAGARHPSPRRCHEFESLPANTEPRSFNREVPWSRDPPSRVCGREPCSALSRGPAVLPLCFQPLQAQPQST